MASVMGLKCARAHVISEVISGMNNPKVIVSKNGQINGRDTFTKSEKRQRSILRRVTLRRPVRSIGVDIYAMRDEGYRKGIIGAEKVLQENFLPSNLFGKSKTLPPIVGSLSTSTVKKYVLGLQNTLTPAKDKCNSLLHTSCEMIGAVTGKQYFSNADNIRAVKGKTRDGKKYRDDANDEKIQGILRNQGAFEK